MTRGRLLPAWLLALAVTSAAQAQTPGYAELAAALRAGDTAAVQALLAAGVSPSVSDGKGAAPLLMAASRGQHANARALLAAGANPDPRLASYDDATPLMLAINNRDLPMAQLLLDGGAQVDLVDRHGDPALNWACFYGDLPAVELLLQHHANAALVGHGSALEVAMRRGHQAVVERLVDHLKVRSVPATLDQPLITAIDHADVAATKAALEAGANPNALDATGRPLLGRAARGRSAEIVALLLATGADPNAADRIGFTPLFEAARDGRLDNVRELLLRGADANRTARACGLGMTALHAAASAHPVNPDTPALMRLLVRAGARVDARDAEQATPLMWAVNADTAAAITLVELGADPDLVPAEGSSPRATATDRELKDLLAAMQRAKAL
jgi:ankyrin repeat protein